MELYRPRYHFLPEKNWMNDPNGPIFYKAEYHLFYQYNPNDKVWGDIHWGHAKSRDLVYWEHLPIALYPSEELGEKHCFSGCIVLNGETPTLFYTSIGSGDWNPITGAQQWMATSDDDMLSWKKYDKNPVLSLNIHGDLEIKEWRDPFIWKDNNRWYMVLGGSSQGSGCALIYESNNLTDWKYVNIISEGTDITWECPSLFKLDDQVVIIYSPIKEDGNSQVRYMMGDFSEDGKFLKKKEGTIDYSGIEGYYAPNNCVDAFGRRIMFGWITEQSRNDFLLDADWAGIQALPRILSLGEKGELKMSPIPELRKLRKEYFQASNVELTNEDWTPEINGRAMEIVTKINWEEECDESISIEVLKSQNGQEYTVITFDKKTGEITVNRERSSLSDKPSHSILTGQLLLEPGESLTLHIFIDHSVIEVFANYRETISTRVYPTMSDSVGISVKRTQKEEGKVHVERFEVWKLGSIWKNEVESERSEIMMGGVKG